MRGWEKGDKKEMEKGLFIILRIGWFIVGYPFPPSPSSFIEKMQIIFFFMEKKRDCIIIF